MCQHASGEQSQYGQPPVEALLLERRVLLVGVVVPGTAAEHRHVSVGKGTLEREILPNAHLLERFS